jgi:hypothetical protein
MYVKEHGYLRARRLIVHGEVSATGHLQSMTADDGDKPRRGCILRQSGRVYEKGILEASVGGTRNGLRVQHSHRLCGCYASTMGWYWLGG